MKLKDFKQAMDWRRRVGFNGGGYVKKKVLPQPKPKEEAEKVNKARKEKTFEKAKGALENPKEVKEMIDKPKRGLVDEPGSYGGKNVMMKIIDYLNKLPEGSVVENIEALAAKLKVSDSPVRRAMKKLGIKSRYEVDKAEGSMFKIENDPKFRKQFLKDAKTRTPAMIQNDYNISKTSFGRLTRDLKLKPGKDYIEDRGVPTPKPEVTKNANKLLKLLKKDKSIKNFSDVITKTTFSDVEAMSAIRALNRNLKIPQIKGEIGKPGVIKTRFDIPANLKNKINKIEETGNVGFSPFEEELKTKKILSDKDIKNLFRAPGFKLREYLKKGSEFEHALPKSLIPFVAKNKKEADALYLTGSRTSPFLNSFKRNFDVTQKSLVQQFLNNKISLDQYNSKINKLRKTIKDATGGYETGYIKFDKDKNPTAVLNATSVKEPLEGFGPRTSQTIKALDNVKFTSNLLKNYKKNKNNPIYGSLKLKGVDLDEIIENYDQIGNEYKKVKPLLSNKEKLKEYAEDNLQSPVTKLLFQSPYGKAGAALTGSALTFSKLAADEGDGGIIPTKDVDGNLVAMELPKTDAETLDEFKKGATSVLPTAAASGTGAAAVGTKRGRSLLGKAFRTLGTPLSGLGFAATNVASKMGEGQSFADAVVDPLTGLELSFPGLFRENISKITRSPTLQKVLGLGRFGRMLTPVGLGLATLGQAQEFYNQRQNLQRMREQNPRAYSEFMSRRVAPALSTAEQTAIEDMGRFGAAGGGIMKMAGKSSGPAPESGPTPQGLDFLMKRGR
jgi:hypothetical protein